MLRAAMVSIRALLFPVLVHLVMRRAVFPLVAFARAACIRTTGRRAVAALIHFSSAISSVARGRAVAIGFGSGATVAITFAGAWSTFVAPSVAIAAGRWSVRTALFLAGAVA